MFPNTSDAPEMVTDIGKEGEIGVNSKSTVV
jgi:hypothetical protein